MKISLAIAFLFVSAVAYCQVDAKAQSLISLHKRKFDWLINKKTDSLNVILDERVIYVHSNGATETKKELIDHLNSGLVSYQAITVDEAKARLYGETGIVTGRGTFTGKWGENSFSLPLAYTEVYVKVKKQWVLVSRAAARIVE